MQGLCLLLNKDVLVFLRFYPGMGHGAWGGVTWDFEFRISNFLSQQMTAELIDKRENDNAIY